MDFEKIFNYEYLFGLWERMENIRIENIELTKNEMLKHEPCSREYTRFKVISNYLEDYPYQMFVTGGLSLIYKHSFLMLSKNEQNTIRRIVLMMVQNIFKTIDMNILEKWMVFSIFGPHKIEYDWKHLLSCNKNELYDISKNVQTWIELTFDKRIPRYQWNNTQSMLWKKHTHGKAPNYFNDNYEFFELNNMMYTNEQMKEKLFNAIINYFNIDGKSVSKANLLFLGDTNLDNILSRTMFQSLPNGHILRLGYSHNDNTIRRLDYNSIANIASAKDITTFKKLTSILHCNKSNTLDCYKSYMISCIQHQNTIIVDKKYNYDEFQYVLSRYRVFNLIRPRIDDVYTNYDDYCLINNCTITLPNIVAFILYNIKKINK